MTTEQPTTGGQVMDVEDPAATRPLVVVNDDSPATANGTGKATANGTMTANRPQIVAVSWYRQFTALVRWKTLPVLSRKPVTLTFLLLSSVVSVILSSLAGPNVKDVAPRDSQCGAPDVDYFTIPPALENHTIDFGDGNIETYTTTVGGIDYYNSAAVSINDNWLGGAPVVVLSLGPLMTAFAVYFIVHEEIQLDLFGIIRGLGVCDSAYWISWFIPFVVLAMVNALLGAIAAQMAPVHVRNTCYYYHGKLLPIE
jgi:hypothetical protein